MNSGNYHCVSISAFSLSLSFPIGTTILKANEWTRSSPLRHVCTGGCRHNADNAVCLFVCLFFWGGELLGPRSCIGARFSQIEQMIFLAKLLHEFDFECTNTTEPVPLDSFTLKGFVSHPSPAVTFVVLSSLSS